MAKMTQKEMKAAIYRELESGDANKAFMLLTESNVSANAKHPEADKPSLLALAAQRGHEGLINELLARGATVDAKHKGVPVIQYATTAEAVRALAAAGADVNAQRTTASADHPKGTTALHMAHARGDIRVATELMQAGADASLKDRNGATPLDLGRRVEPAPQEETTVSGKRTEYERLDPEGLGLDQDELSRLAAKRKSELELASKALAPQPSATPSAQTESNSIEDARTGKLAPDARAQKVATADAKQFDPRAIPADLKRQFIQADNKYFYEKSHDTLAFVDKGSKLETPSNGEAMAENLVRIAELRGWSTIKVSGSEEFRRQAWMAATARGIEVTGYEPKPIDVSLLERKMQHMDLRATEGQKREGFRGRENSANTQIAKAQQAEKSTAPEGEILGAHGHAPFEHSEKNSASYFVNTLDSAGKEKTYWGVDLGRAIAESGAQTGDRVKLENLGKTAVTIDVPVRDDKGNIVGHEKKETHRNEWKATVKQSFEAVQAEVLKKHPDMAAAVASTAAISTAIDKQAQIDGLSVEQRRVVQERVQANIQNSIERGNPPRMAIKERAAIAPKKAQDATREAGR